MSFASLIVQCRFVTCSLKHCNSSRLNLAMYLLSPDCRFLVRTLAPLTSWLATLAHFSASLIADRSCCIKGLSGNLFSLASAIKSFRSTKSTTKVQLPIVIYQAEKETIITQKCIYKDLYSVLSYLQSICKSKGKKNYQAFDHRLPL